MSKLLLMPSDPTNEPWVNLETLATHIGFGVTSTRTLVRIGMIPGRQVHNGDRLLWRFLLSEVDRCFAVPKPPQAERGKAIARQQKGA